MSQSRRWLALWFVIVLASCSGSGTGRKPDLTAESLSFAPTRIAAGQQGAVTFSLKNAGAGDAGSFAFQIWIEGTDRGSRSMLAEQGVEEIAHGQARSQSLNVTIPSATRPGTYRLSVVVDSTSAIDEVDESNNSVDAASSITVLARGSDVNLTPSNVTLSVPSALPDDVVTVSYSLRNSGRDGILATTKTEFYLSLDDQKSADDRKIGEHSVGAIPSGQTLSPQAQVTVPAGTSSGPYKLLVVADGAGALAENDENDNVASTPITVESGTVRGTDLVITELSVTPTSVPRGGGITVSFSLKNRGDTATASSFFNRVYLSPSQAFDAGNAEVLDTVNVTGLGAGETRSFQRSVVIPASRNPGTYYVVVVADPSNVVAEANDQNNVRVDAAGVTVTPPAQADAVAENVVVSGPDGGTVAAGTELGVSFRVGNNGPDATSSITANILLSTDTTASPSDRVIGRVDVVNLAPTQNQTFTERVTIPTDIDNRRYFIGVIVDPDERLVDPNRTNNAAFDQAGFTVTGGAGCTDDNLEPNDARDAPRTITPGSYPSLFLCTGNEDWYSVRVEQGWSVKAGISSSASPEPDFDLYIYKPGADGELIDSSAGGGSTEQVTANFVDATGDYLVRVSAFRGQGAYSLTLNVTPAGGNGIDLVPVDLTAGVAHADPGDSVSFDVDARNVGMVAAPDFKFELALVPADATCPNSVSLGVFTTATLPAGQARKITQAVTLPVGTCNGDYFPRVTLDPGNEIAETYNENNTFTATSRFTVGGINGCVDDSLEPNDNRLQARTIAPGTIGSLKGCPEDDDWYSVFLGAGEALDVSINFDNDQGDLDLRLEDANGGYLDSSTSVSSDTERVTYTAQAAERVYIRVNGYFSSTSNGNAYSMTVTGGAGVDLIVKDLTVTPLAQYAGDDVTVQFTVENLLPLASPATTAEVRFRSSGGQETTAASVNVPALGTTTPDGVRKSFSPRVTVPSGLAVGTYEVRAVVDPTNAVREPSDDNNTATQTGFRVVAPCAPDAQEPNDSSGEAPDVTPTSGTQTTITNLNICLGDNDWFKIVVASGQTRNLTATITFTQANGDLDLFLYRRETGGSLTELARSTTNPGNETVSQTGLGAGTYFLKVVGFNNATNSYGLSLTLAP
jgi:subtilase family serine protease